MPSRYSYFQKCFTGGVAASHVKKELTAGQHDQETGGNFDCHCEEIMLLRYSRKKIDEHHMFHTDDN